MVKAVVKLFYDLSGPSNLQNILMDEIEKKFQEFAEIERINIDENKNSANDYNVTEAPTTVIEINDKEVERFVGLTQELFLRKSIERNLKELK